MKKVALITGASSGIGYELAHIHAEWGGDLVIVARRKERLEKLKEELSTKHRIKVMVIVKDLSKPESPQEIYNEIKNAGIEIDYLINNAGFGGQGKFYEKPWEKDNAMIKVNILALTALTRLFLPDFVKRNSGKILNVSSIASLTPGPLQAVYFASKAYIAFFSNAIAEELRDTNITVTTLMPGPTQTGFAEVSEMENALLFKNSYNARKVAESGHKGMLSGKMDVIAGVSGIQRVLVAMIPLIPKKSMLRYARKMQEVN